MPAVAPWLHGITNIQTSAQAAEALRPIAGKFAFFIFAQLINGVIAVPIMIVMLLLLAHDRRLKLYLNNYA